MQRASPDEQAASTADVAGLFSPKSYLGALTFLGDSGPSRGDMVAEVRPPRKQPAPVPAAPTARPRIHLERDPACNPIGIGSDCFLPYPSSYYTRPDPSTPTGIRLAYDKATFRPAGTLPLDLSLLDFADGASPVTPILVNFGVDVDPSQLWGYREVARSFASGAPVAVLDETTGRRVPIMAEMDRNQRNEEYAGRWALILRPLAPLTFGHRYEVVLTDALHGVDGKPLPRSAVFDALRDETPTDDPGVEALRPHYEDLFATAAAAGFPRDRLLLAWDFQVASERSVLRPIQSMRDQALAAIREHGVPYHIHQVVRNPNPRVAWIVRGTFTPPGFLKDDQLVRDAHDDVRRQQDASYPFTMLIPPQGRTGGHLVLLVFGHGLFGTGDQYISRAWGGNIVEDLSVEHAGVVVATDWIGLSGEDFALARHIALHPEDLRVVPNRLAQAIVNNIALTALALGPLEHDPVIGRADTADLVDPNKVVYYGSSLGGVEGTSLVAVSPQIRQAAVADAGGGWADILERSADFARLAKVLDLRYPDPLGQALYIAAMQQFFDEVDPANVGRLLKGDPDLPDAPPRQLLMQESIGDCRVPNLSTELLARALGAHQLAYASVPIYGLDLVAAPTHTTPELSQFVLPEALARFTPPDTDTIPRRDNKVHYRGPMQPDAVEQAMALFTGHGFVNLCDGPCDPE